jgi:beta-mannosidase
MQAIGFGGEWTLRQASNNERIKATVPGSIHTDLLASGLIPDPHYRDNEDNRQWISETAWIYQ